MIVGTLGVDNLAEHTGLRHCKGGKFEEVVAAVLQNYAVLASALGSVDQVPAGLKGFGGRNLDSYVFAVLHSVQGDGHVMEPVGADIDQINGRVLAKLLISLVRAGIRSCNLASGSKKVNILLYPVRLYIAHGGDMAARNICQAVNRSAAPVADADYSYSYVLDRLRAELNHIFLSCGTGRRGGADDTIIVGT